jgi:hypothetical protein
MYRQNFINIAKQSLREISTSSRVNLNYIEPKLIPNKYLPTYNVHNEMQAISDNLQVLLKEVPQEYQKWEEINKTLELPNPQTKKLEKKKFRYVDYINPEVPELPIADPRDTHKPYFQRAETKHWANHLINLRKQMRRDNYLWIEGSETIQILKHVFGANEEDLNDLENASDNMNHDAHFAYKKRSMNRLSLDMKSGIAHRLTHTAYVLSDDDGLVKEGLTGVHRFYGETQDWVMQNSAFQGLISLKAFLIYGNMDVVPPRPGTDPNRNINVTTNFHRIITTPTITGTSTPEGVHHDGSEYTMTTYLKSHNVDFEGGSAVVSLLNLEQPLGVDAQEVDPKNIIKSIQHRNYLDTLVIIDQALSHVATDMKAKHVAKPANRDIVVITARKMAEKGGNYITAPFEEEEIPHQTLPCVFGIKSKHLANHYNTACGCQECTCQI